MFSSAIHLVSYAFHTVSRLFHLAPHSMCSLLLVIFGFLRRSHFRVVCFIFFARRCFASCFYSYVPILLCATLLFIEHASFLFFIQLVGRAALERLSLYLLLLSDLSYFAVLQYSLLHLVQSGVPTTSASPGPNSLRA